MIKLKIIKNYGKSVRVKSKFYLNIPLCKFAYIEGGYLTVAPKFLAKKESEQIQNYWKWKTENSNLHTPSNRSRVQHSRTCKKESPKGVSMKESHNYPEKKIDVMKMFKEYKKKGHKN